MKKCYKLDKFYEDNGLSLEMSISFYTSEDGKKMELCSCTISNGCKSVDYAWVVGTTTLDDVIKEFLGEED